MQQLETNLNSTNNAVQSITLVRPIRKKYRNSKIISGCFSQQQSDGKSVSEKTSTDNPTKRLTNPQTTPGPSSKGTQTTHRSRIRGEGNLNDRRLFFKPNIDNGEKKTNCNGFQKTE